VKLGSTLKLHLPLFLVDLSRKHQFSVPGFNFSNRGSAPVPVARTASFRADHAAVC